MEAIETGEQAGIFRNFPGYREGQEETIHMALESGSKFVMVSAPTGVGKSLIGMTISHHAQPSVYTVTTKMLQDQMGRDFPEAVVLKGRGNYPCPRYAEYELQADSCVKHGCSHIADCGYEIAKMDAIQADYRVLNLAYFLTETNAGKGNFSQQDMVIVDEADGLEQGLVDYISLTISIRDRKLLERSRLPPDPPRMTQPDTWKGWAGKCIPILKRQQGRLEAILKAGVHEGMLKEFKAVKRLLSKFNILFQHSDDSWIRYIQGESVVYKPVWLTPALSEAYLFRHSKRWVLMSATFPQFEVYCRLLGMPVSDTDYITLPSPFEVSKRQVYYNPVADMSYKANEIDKLLTKIKELMAIHHDTKGVIHTTSYRLNELIAGLDTKRCITHTSTDKEQVIEAFRASGRPLVLVSPSVERGVSFDGDLARWQIIAKVPYQSTQDRVVSARLYSGQRGQEWYQADAAQRIVQMCGRGTRSVDDYSVCYILDKQFSKLIHRPRLFPEWFIDAIEFS